jgi:glycosyltransferase involved in cell wall biosynthesis
MAKMATFGVRQFNRNAYDLVELWGGTSWLLAVLLRTGTAVPIVHHSNGIEQHYTELWEQKTEAGENEHWFQLDLSPLYDLGLRASDAIVTVSSFDLPFLRRRGYLPESRLYAINNPLPDFFLDRTVQPDRPKRVGFCGSWIPKKGIDVLRTDVAAFLREHPEWTFSVVGVGETDIRAQFPVEVRDQLEVISFLEREELAAWYHRLSVFVLPSIAESFGLVAAEAMACGAALVMTDVGFAHDLADEREALILPASTRPHLYRALTRLVNDESLRRQVAQNGYERVQNLRWEDAVDRLESIYQSLVS